MEEDGTVKGGPVRYSVRKVNGQWQLWTPGKRNAILRSNSREELVRMAQQIATEHGGELVLYREDDEVEAATQFPAP